ncbi:MAG: hypothetical protein E7384_02945 [Ruminococcaceae bacterium]|nr:hypothetical protein [Oscillospiraceae bacterium]
MANEFFKLGDRDVSVKISCDRTKSSIDVIGDFTATDAVKKVKESFADTYCKLLLTPDISSVPGGYVMNIHGRKSVKDCISEKYTVTCTDIFQIARNIKELYDKYGQVVFSQIIFDYAVVFVKQNITDLDFVFVPFSDKDGKRSDMCELLHILFIHMSFFDNESEIAVAELIKKIRKWQVSGYDQIEYREFSEYIEGYLSHDKKKQKEIFSKGGTSIRQFFGNFQGEAKKRSKRCLCISIFCDESDKNYVCMYDPQEDLFFVENKIVGEKRSYPYSLKIGREKAWAAVYADDMTVSGRFGEIVCTNNKFILNSYSAVDSGNDGLCQQNDAYILKDGQKIKIGKRLYTVKLQSQRYLRYR